MASTEERPADRGETDRQGDRGEAGDRHLLPGTAPLGELTEQLHEARAKLHERGMADEDLDADDAERFTRRDPAAQPPER